MQLHPLFYLTFPYDPKTSNFYGVDRNNRASDYTADEGGMAVVAVAVAVVEDGHYKGSLVVLDNEDDEA
jgi:hypothetical protein